MNLVRRSEWRAREPDGQVHLRVPPLGVKIHYVGGRVDPAIAQPGKHAMCVKLVKGVQLFHMQTHRWADIGYTALCCPHREIFEGRGVGILPAANGAGLNAEHYAVCALLGDSGLTDPPDGLLHGLVDAIEWLRGHGAGRQVKGHRDGYDTSCPGDRLYAWIGQGHPRPGGDDGDGGGEGPAWPGRVLEFPPLMDGDDVTVWQKRMRHRWGFEHLDVDGVFGPDTREVTRRWQTHRGLRSTGRVTRRDWEAAWPH